MFAHEQIVKIIDMIEELRDKAGLRAKELPAAGRRRTRSSRSSSRSIYDEFRDAQADRPASTTAPTQIEELRDKRRRRVRCPRTAKPKYTPGQVAAGLRAPSKSASSAT